MLLTQTTGKIQFQPKPAPRALPLVQALKTFHHTIDIYLKDSNAYANTYFSRYFEWQGVCRERWFHRCISADMLQTTGVFITKCAPTRNMRTRPFRSRLSIAGSILLK